jgi:dipeptidyl aminopeptidase/acylaminoacyl peptidase
MLKRLAFVSCALVLLVAALHADAPRAKQATRSTTEWTVDDVVNAETAADFRISPDGRWVVYVKAIADDDKDERVGQLFRASLSEKKELQLTRGSESCYQPRWSPDGKYLAFLSARPPHKKAKDKGKDEEPKAQVWLMDVSGGEPWPLTEGSRAVSFFEWSGPDTLLFGAKEAPTLRESTTKDDKKDDSTVIDDEKNEPPVRLFKVEVSSKKVTRVTDNTDRITALAVSPDGKYAVTIHNRSLAFVYDNKIKPIVLLTDLARGERKQLFKEPKYNIEAVRWTRDGKGFYASSQFTSHPRYVHATVTELYHYDLAGHRPRKVDLAWERGLATQSENGDREGFVVTTDGFLALLADGARNRVARYVRTPSPLPPLPRGERGRGEGDAWKREWLSGEHAANLFGLELSPDGKTLVYAQSTASTPTQWFRAPLDGTTIGKPAVVADSNEALRQKTRARTEVVRWKGARDEEVEGILYYPHHYKAGDKYPLLLMIHGGPFGADFDGWEETWSYPANLYAQRGAFVLKANYHGSSNYGLKFAESIANGKYYELPLVDLERGAAALVARGLVDPKRVATMGWSNGAILSAALLTRNPTYKAASLGAGGAEWVGDWGACEFGCSFSNYYFGKSPLEDPQLYIKMAPLYQFDRVRTPTILFQGDADRAVPPHHAWSQFRTLQALGKTEARLVMFPEEPHSLKKLVHRRRKLREELAWFDKHLFKTFKEENLALKAGSPLDRAIKRRAARRDGLRYGMLEKGVLVPETVAFEGIEVGRFEVTLAQYAEFDKGCKVEPGKENYPVTGITCEKAQEYCRWLSQRTGRTYRLPDAAEAKKLYDDRDGTGENTLDYWAGYAPNPDDAARLGAKIKELGGQAALLQPVGRFKGAGKEQMVFDLGGNAAEWVRTADGKGHAAGGWAARAADSRTLPGNPPPEYVGFRVVRGR